MTTSLWRKDRVTQFRPNETAVVELLKFLGFQKVSKLQPTLIDLEKRYYNGERGTFLTCSSVVSEVYAFLAVMHRVITQTFVIGDRFMNI